MDLVTVIIPTYKSGGSLTAAIESVLSQSYKEVEIIVIDDNDPTSIERKETENLMKRYSSDTRVEYILHDKNMNGAVARNTGIKAANGKYITFLDDDIYYEQRIEKCISALNEKPECEAVYTTISASNVNLPTYNMEFPLVHPSFVMEDKDFDKALYNSVFRGSSKTRLKRLVKGCLRSINKQW